MKRLKTSNITDNSALPIKAGTLEFLQDAYKEGFASLIIGLIGNSTYSNRVFLLYGCELTGTSGSYNIAGGAVFYQGEIYLVDNTQDIHAFSPSVIFMAIVQEQYTTNADPVTFTDGNAHNVHDIKKIAFSSSLADNIDTYPNLITCLQSSVTSKGVVQLASINETIGASPIATKAITPEGVQFYTGRVKTKAINIGIWNMYNNSYKTINHGLTNSERYRILSISVHIYGNDSGTEPRELDEGVDYTNTTRQGFVRNITSTTLELVRLFDGIFYDETNYGSDNNFNRGYVNITYIP